MISLLPKKARHVLGHNARTLHYTGQDNPKAAKKLAHDKLATKKLLQKAGLPTPRLYATIKSRQELNKFRWTKLPSSFVVKPNASSGGSGIVVIFGRNKKGNWVKANKSEVFIPHLRSHISEILDGSFSASGTPDITLFEQRIKNHPDLKRFSPQGIPDIRVIVYNSVPVMAMLRLSTPESHGKANLHAGGIGVGIDLADGITTTGIYRGQLIEHFPGTQHPISHVTIPHWPDVLTLAVKVARAAGLPFAGVDIAIDRDDGPVALEINAHPGLEIQVANLAPLRSRLRRVEDLKVSTAARGVQLGRNLFGQELNQDDHETLEPTTLGITEAITITDSDGHPRHVTAKVDTGAWRTTIDRALARELGLGSKIIERAKVRSALGHQERPIIELTMKLRDQTIKTNVFIADRSRLRYPMIIGRRDLKGFLVDPYLNARDLSQD